MIPETFDILGVAEMTGLSLGCDTDDVVTIRLTNADGILWRLLMAREQHKRVVVFLATDQDPPLP